MAQRWKKAGSLTTGGMSLNVFTQDEMDAIHRATLEVLEHTGVEAVNLGTGRGSSVLEIVSAYSKACGRELPYRIAPRRPGDIAVCYADTEKARRLFGWEAKRGIDQMCADSWNFAKNRYLK